MTAPKNITEADIQNETIWAQVESEMPKPIGGFESDDDADHFNAIRDARFLELCRNYVG